MRGNEASLRLRRAADIDSLAAVLRAQQAETRYPFRDPLPIPVEDFLHATDAAGAWVAERDGALVGHVCRTGPASGFAAADLLNRVCADAHGCDVATLTWVNALFVGSDARGHGIGRRLLEAVRRDALEHGLHPCLEVLPLHPAALSLYLATGWRIVHSFRPEWLRATAGDEGPNVQVLVFTTSDGAD